MTVHVLAAMVAFPLLIWHVRSRPQRLRPGDLSRRTVLHGAAVAGGALVVRAATRADLRFTGSYEIGSFDPEQMPVVQWFDDRAPTIPLEEWVLTVQNQPVSYDELVARSNQLVATLDCTGGWFSTQEWRGVPVSRLLSPDASGRSIVVTSATGYARRFPAGDATNLLLATGVGAQPLSRGHGFPLRLVAPGRRGLWWVKWVTDVRMSDRPWWLQSPVPLA